MGDSIKCPSCCDQIFDSKAQLIEHLAHLLGEITCPICNNKWSSIGHLVEHLSLDNCSRDSVYNIPIQGYNIIEDTPQSDCQAEELLKPKLNLLDNDSLSFSKENSEMVASEDADSGKMYIEFLSKQLTRPCLQTQEVKLIKDNGVSRYVFLTDDDEPPLDDSSTIVTKQNNDGTISLTAVEDMAQESDTLITQESDMDNNQQEVYSCNTCGVSFTSVLDHIQNYHNDQDVVVEEQPAEEGSESHPPNIIVSHFNPEDSVAPKEESHVNGQQEQSLTNGHQTGRRMITDTGDIVEAPLVNASLALDSMNTAADSRGETVFYTIHDFKNDPQSEDAGVDTIEKPPEEILPDFKEERKSELENNAGKSGPYHKVVIKELTTGDGQKIRMFQCISCHIHVTYLDDYKTKPCKPRRLAKFQCSHCLGIFANAKSLCAHMKVHKEKAGPGTPAPVPLSNKPITYGCEVCLTVFTTNKSLKLHKRMHDPIRERPIEPPVETAEGGVASSDKYLCSVCHKLIPIDYRDIHQNSHNNIEKFNCDICNKKFSSKDYLEMHMNVHNVDKISVGKQDESLPYLCVYCDRRFARPHEKVKHERIHTGEKPHSCEICGKSFRVSYCLTLHMRTHTGARPYACPHCGKRFKAHSVYNHHMLTHSDVRAYKCPFCPKAFKTSVQLAGHKNSHTKPFSCQYCNRPFASLYAVRVHTETHTRQNNLKFSCTVCGASYARAFALKDHVKQAHNTKDMKDGEEVIMEILTSELPVVS